MFGFNKINIQHIIYIVFCLNMGQTWAQNDTPLDKAQVDIKNSEANSADSLKKQNRPNVSLFNKLINIEIGNNTSPNNNVATVPQLVDINAQITTLKNSVDSFSKSITEGRDLFKQFSETIKNNQKIPTEITLKIVPATLDLRINNTRKNQVHNNQLQDLKNELLNLKITLDRHIYQHEPNQHIYVSKSINIDSENLLWQLFFITVILFLVLFITRFIRYQIKLHQHRVDRSEAINLSRRLNITLEEALMITSTAHLDFKVPDVSVDVLAQYYLAKNSKKQACCCGCCACLKSCSKCSENKQKDDQKHSTSIAKG